MKRVAGDTGIRQVVPKGVRDLDARLDVFMYSTQEDQDRLKEIKKNEGRKPKASDPSS